MSRNFLAEEVEVKNKAKEYGLDLYMFIKQIIMNMNIESNCTEYTYREIVKSYARKQASMKLTKDEELIKITKQIIVFLDERFSILKHTHFQQQKENPYYLHNLNALNNNFKFEDRPKRFQVMTAFDIIEAMEKIRNERKDLRKKYLYVVCGDLQANGDSMEDYKQ